MNAVAMVAIVAIVAMFLVWVSSGEPHLIDGTDQNVTTVAKTLEPLK